MSINAQPFQPQFKLIGNLVEDQVLVYDTSEGAFVNSTASGGGGASGYDAVANMGTGTALYYGDAGTTLQLKTIIGGSDITLTDNGTGGIIIATTSTDTVQDGTNLGTGTALFSSKHATTHALQFKSIVAGAGLTLTDDGAGTLTLVNDIAAGTTDADLTLSNLSNVATARTNLDVYSKTESNTKFLRTDASTIPSTNNTFDIGSPTYKWNDIYAETFQGTAVLADQLTISGTTGQVLTYNGSSWTAADTSGGTLLGQSDVSNVAPADGQHLVWNTTTGLWTPSAPTTGGGGYSDTDARNSISVSGDLSYNAVTGVVSYTTPTDTDTTYTAGTGLTLTGTVFSNTSPDQTVALTGTGATSITGTYPNFTITSTDTDTNTTYTNVSEFTNDSGYLTSVPAQAWSTITGTPTTIAGYGITDAFDSSSAFPYGNLTGTPTIPSGNQIIDWTSASAGTIHASNYTNTDTNTTYTAGSGLSLVGTEFSLTASHFDGAFSSLSGVATVTASDDAKVLYYDHSTTSFKWKTDASTPAGYNNTNWDTAYGWGNHASAGYLTSVTAHYDNDDVDTHLNVSGATTNQMLKWTGTDYAWVTSTDTDTTYVSSDFTHDDLTGFVTNEHIDWTTDQGSTNLHAGNYTNTTYSNLSEFTNDSGYITSTGLLSSHTDVHTSAPTNGDVLKWDAGNSRWHAQADSVGSVTPSSTDTFTNKSGDISQWTNDSGFISSVPAQSFASLTGKPTTIAGYGITDRYANAEVDAHLNTGTATANQALVWTGTDYDWVTSTDSDTTYTAGANISINGSNVISATDTNTTYTNVSEFINDAGYLTSETAHYTDSDVNTHLNTSTAIANQVLSWTGTDYDWISSGAHFDGDYNSLTNKPTIPSTIDDLADVTISGTIDGQFLQYNNTTGDWENETISLFDGVYSSLTGAPTIPTLVSQLTNDSGFITTDTDTTYTAGTNVTISGTNVISATDTNTDTTYTAGTNVTISGTNVISATDTNTDTTYTAGTGLTLAGTVFSNTSPDQTVALTGTGATTVTGTYPNFTIASTDTDTNTIYANSDVDLHLNKGGSVTSGYILSWDGSDYNWIANSGTPAWSAITGKPTTIAGYGITDTFFDGVFGSLTSKPTTLSGYGITDATDTDTTYTAGTGLTLTGTVFSNTSPDQTVALTGSGATTITGTYPNFTIASTDTNTDTNTTYTAGSGLTLTGTAFSLTAGHFDGAYSSLSGTPFLYSDSSVDSHLNQSNPTSGHVLSWNGSDYVWVANSSGGVTASSTDTFTNKSGAISQWTNDSNYLTSVPAQTFASLTSKPTTLSGYGITDGDPVTAGTGVQINSGIVSLTTLSGHSDVDNATPTDGQVLKWDNSNSRWAPGTDLTSGSSAMNDLSDVDTSGISTGQYLKWNGSAFVASTVSGGGASAINDLSDVDTNTSSPSNGDVLTWVQADSEWAPAAPSGGGGSGSAVEYFKLNYATNGNLTSISNATSGISATILSATGGDVEITFSGTNYPPAGILLYGYAYSTNEYVIMPLNKDISTRKVAGGGSAGSPIAFGTMGSVDLTLKLREADTGASRSFGTDTHAWIMFTVI